MSYGGDETKRDPNGLVTKLTKLFEAIGLLNKNSAGAPAAPDPADATKVTNISGNSLNVTRVTGVGALVTATGAAALAIFNVDKNHDPRVVVVAAFVSAGIIVAAALIAVAVIIAADINARKAVAVATPSSSVPSKPPADGQISIAILTPPLSGHIALEADKLQKLVLVDASTLDTDLTLPSAGAAPMRDVTVRRIDRAQHHAVNVHPVNGDQGKPVNVGEDLRLYSDGQHWHDL